MDENAERISLELIAGDEQAFDTVYKQYYRGLCAFASQYVTVPESEEIVQDVMMWLWENRCTLMEDLTLKIPSSGHVPEITPLHHCPQ